MNDRYKTLLFKNQALKNKISNAEESNRKHEEYKNKYNKLSTVLQSGENYQNILECLLLRCKVEDTKFKEERLHFLEEAIQEGFDYIFPNENITPKLEYVPFRGKNVASLKLLVPNPSTTEQDYLQPKNASGLQKQLIAFTGAATVCDLLGLNKIFVDEAFNNSSTENKFKLGKVLEMFKDKGMQIFLISQDVALYQDLPRREIHINKKSISNSLGVTYVEEIKDWN